MTGRPRGPRPSRADMTRLYVRAGLSLRDTADALGITKDLAARVLEEYGIPRRPFGHKRSQLADIPLDVLEANVKADGFRGHARTLGVDRSTLRSYIRAARLRSRRRAA